MAGIIKSIFLEKFLLKKSEVTRVFCGTTFEAFEEGYDWESRQFDKSKVKRKNEKSLYVTLESYCGYSRKWAVNLSGIHGSSPIVFSGLVRKEESEYYMRGIVTIPSGKMAVDRIYLIKSKDGKYHNIRPEDNNFMHDADISNLI